MNLTGKLSIRLKCLYLLCIGLIVPLAFIGIAAWISGWFNIVDNALSDLGHALKSNVAIMFNLGLSLGAFILVIYSLICAVWEDKVYGILLLVSSYLLNLIAVFNEVYGRIHFIVSLLFFTSLMTVIIVYGMRWRKTLFPVAAVTSFIVIWYLYFVYDIPRGAAIPELLSILIVAPFMLDYALKLSCKRLERFISEKV